MLLKARPLSAIPQYDTLEALLASSSDGIFLVGKRGTRDSWQYLQDCGFAPYVIKLVNPLLVPRRAIRWNLNSLKVALNWGIGRPTPPLPSALFYGRADLLVTSDGCIIADSFSRGTFVHPSIRPTGDKTWTVPYSGTETLLKGRHQYLELVPGHFGHMLVDMPGRLWTASEPELSAIADLPSVAFATHGMQGRSGMPALLARLLNAMGLAPDRVVIADRPMRVQELIIARRISPHRGPGGPRYNRVMVAAGRRIAADNHGTTQLVYFSRSRLSHDRRPVARATALQIDDLFAKRGFTVVHPQDLDIADQISVVRGATHIAGFVGSQLHLSAFSERRGLKLLVICPGRFHTGTDQRIVGPLGGEVTDLVFPGPSTFQRLLRGRRLHLTAQDLDRIDAAITAFVGSDKGAG